MQLPERKQTNIYILSFKITCMTAALVAVLFGIYTLKTKGLSDGFKAAVGVFPASTSTVRPEVKKSPRRAKVLIDREDQD